MAQDIIYMKDQEVNINVKNLNFFVHHNNYGCIEIVCIFYNGEELKYLSDSEMSTCQLSGCYNKKYLKIIICV